MFQLIKDPTTLCLALRELVAFYDGVAPPPTALEGLLIGVNGELTHITLRTALLEVIDDYETRVLPQIAKSLRATAIDNMV